MHAFTCIHAPTHAHCCYVLRMTVLLCRAYPPGPVGPLKSSYTRYESLFILTSVEKLHESTSEGLRRSLVASDSSLCSVRPHLRAAAGALLQAAVSVDGVCFGGAAPGAHSEEQQHVAHYLPAAAVARLGPEALVQA